MIKLFDIPANTSKEEAEKILKQKATEFGEYVKPQDGHMIILQQFLCTAYNFVYHKGQWRFVGEY